MMKITYTCDICGFTTNNEFKALEHERIVAPVSHFNPGDKVEYRPNPDSDTVYIGKVVGSQIGGENHRRYYRTSFSAEDAIAFGLHHHYLCDNIAAGLLPERLRLVT